MSITDGILNALTGKKIETIRTSREEMAEMVNKYYIIPASTQDELTVVEETIKGGFQTKELDSKDGRYKLRVVRNTSNHNWVWIIDMEKNRHYEYKCTFYGKFKNMVIEKIVAARQNKIYNVT